MRPLLIIASFLFLFINLAACSVQEASRQGNQNMHEEDSNETINSHKRKPNPDTENKKVPDKDEHEVKLVEYTGPVEHIFFHPLIVYPELAFDQDSMAKGYNDYFVTVNEFKRTLKELYENNYILIDINSLIESGEGNTITTQKLMLPEGKKPLVLSIDDMNFYDYMRKNGNAYKLVVDVNGDVASYSKTPDGEDVISYDHAIVPILNQFVKEHPDFSFKGAKGLIALTGYEGVLGYRTNELNSPQYEENKEQALELIHRLKETGWTFASHGYGHLAARKIGYQQLVRDTDRWKKEVEPLIGPTDIYVYPFGSRVETGSRKFKYLIDSGFKILCSVGPRPYLKEYQDSAIMMDRRHIDGISLQTQQNQLSPLLDAEKVLESEVRP